MFTPYLRAFLGLCNPRLCLLLPAPLGKQCCSWALHACNYMRLYSALQLYLWAHSLFLIGGAPYLLLTSLKARQKQCAKGKAGPATAPSYSRRDAVEWRSVREAALKRAVYCRLGRQAAAAGVHGHRQLRAPPHALLVLALEAPVAAGQLQLEVAVAAQAGRAHLRTQKLRLSS